MAPPRGRLEPCWRLALAFLMLAPAAAVAQTAMPEELAEGERLYRQACLPCHGADGSGPAADSPLYSTFETLPADLSDPLFSSREPAADWALVIEHGGAPIGLSSQMPAFGQALTAEQIDALLAYVKSLADTRRYPPGDLNLLRPLVTTKAFPEDELVLEVRRQSGEESETVSLAEYERRVGTRSHVEAKVEYVDGAEDAELEAVELGFRSAIHWSLERQILLSGGAEVDIPVGSDGGSVGFVPYLALAKILSERFTLQADMVADLPVDDVGTGDVRIAAIVHWITTPWPRGVFPGLEAVVEQPFSSDADLASSLVPQLKIGLSRLGHVGLAAGVELPLTDEPYDYRVLVHLLWDIGDGPFWKGW